MSASIRELGGQMLLPGEEVDFDQDLARPMDADAVSGGQEAEV